MDWVELLRWVPWRSVWRFTDVSRLTQNLLLQGLQLEAIGRFKYSHDPCALEGTPHWQRFEDLRGHHLTQMHRDPRYASDDAFSAAREATSLLHRRRSRLIALMNKRSDNGKKSRFVPLPGRTTGKEHTEIREPRQRFQRFQPKKSPLSAEVNPEEVTHEEHERENCLNVDGAEHDKNIVDSHGESETVFGDLNIEEPDDYDIEMAKLEAEAQLEEPSEEEPERRTKRKREATISRESPTPDGDFERGEKRRKLEIGTSSSQVLPAEEPERRTKRKREATISLESPTPDLSGDFERGEKRKKLEIGTSSSQVLPPQQRKQATKVTSNVSELEPAGPSAMFKAFFATRRLRKDLLRKREASWSEEDASFMRSGKEIAEPDASLGAEFAAKSLLDGGRSPLPKLIRDSAMSKDERRRRAFSRPEVEVSGKHQRMLAQMQKSGLNPTEAEPDASPSDPVSEYPLITVGSLMSEVEEELAKWEKEEEEQQENLDNA